MSGNWIATSLSVSIENGGECLPMKGWLAIWQPRHTHGCDDECIGVFCSDSSSRKTRMMTANSGGIFFCHLKLGAVVTLGHDDIRLGLAVAQFLGRLIFGRTVAGERGLKAWKLEHHDAVARAALHHVASTAADQIACAELAEWRLIGDQVWLIGIGVGHVDLDDSLFCSRAAAVKVKAAAARHNPRQ